MRALCFFNVSDTMEDWDQDTLEDVINKKHGGANKNKTDIVIFFNFINVNCNNLWLVFH